MQEARSLGAESTRVKHTQYTVYSTVLYCITQYCKSMWRLVDKVLLKYADSPESVIDRIKSV